MLREMGHWKLETAKLRALQCMHAVKEVGVWNAVSGGVVGWGMVGGWCIYDSGWWLVVVGGWWWLVVGGWVACSRLAWARPGLHSPPQLLAN